MSDKRRRMAIYRQWALGAFLATLVLALVAVVLWDYQWLAAAGVLLVAAVVFGVTGLEI